MFSSMYQIEYNSSFGKVIHQIGEKRLYVSL